ncbi:MAG: hypothetical protein HY962_03535 [Ignavibacteriae bacterium]|nr:hypothetical protein [Ignavibacteriota bacterium]
MKSLRTAALSLLALLVVAGCGKKAEPVSIAAWDQYTDPYYRISFSHPQGWNVSADGSIFKVYSSQEAAEKFFDPYSNKKDGVEIVVGREKLDTLQTLEGYMNAYKEERTAAQFLVKTVEPKKLEDFDGMMIVYSGAYTKENKVTTARVVTIQDSTMYYVQYSGFNELYDSYKVVFDSLLASVRLPKPKSAAETADPSIPSSEFDTFDNFAVKFQYPSNFDVATPRPKGENTFSAEVKGMRQDCSIRIDIFPAKGLSVEKVFEQNEKFYRATGKGSSTIDGLKAPYLSYAPMKGVDSRAYFVVKNDKVIRTIVNYHSPMKAQFLPAFERTVQSMKIK